MRQSERTVTLYATKNRQCGCGRRIRAGEVIGWTRDIRWIETSDGAAVLSHDAIGSMRDTGWIECAHCLAEGVDNGDIPTESEAERAGIEIG